MIKIDENFRRLMVNEMKTALELMKKTNDSREKNYYFSAVYAVINRILNFQFDSQLVFIHRVLEATYSAINNRLIAIARGDTVVNLIDGFFDKLEKYVSLLIERIETKQDNTYDILEKITTLAYTLTGNGYYLYKKGINMGLD